MAFEIDRGIFLDFCRRVPFRRMLTQNQVDGLNALLDAFDKWKAPDLPARAYMLATAFHETAETMRPVREVGEGRGHAYGEPTGPWHKAYYGRGYVQLTWFANYRHATVQLRKYGVIGIDVDLARDPDLMLQTDLAAATLIFGMRDGWFTGRTLGDYFGRPKPLWVEARRIINGEDCAGKIARDALAFNVALHQAAAKAQMSKPVDE
jgi:hypothetical protein